MDDFKLPFQSWDVVIASTDIKSSLLACALSRASLKVLQIDPNPYYGSNATAFSLADLETWAASRPNASSERRLTIDRPRSYTLSLAPHLVYWGSNLLELLRDVEMTQSFTWQAVGSWWVFATDEDVARSAEGGGGIGGVLVGAAAGAVSAAAGGRKKGGWNKGRKRAQTEVTTSTGGDNQAQEAPKPVGGAVVTALRKLGGVLREVPCTFEDVAWSDDLQDRDRGYLGGFLRFVMKCNDPSDTKHHQLLQENKDTPFPDFLAANYPLPPTTIASLHSLSLLPTPPSSTPLSAAVAGLTRHLTSLGRIPDIRSAAALTIAYGGSAELCQVWSRGTAVAGGLNILERDITSISEVDGKLSVGLTNGEQVTADWVIKEASEAAAEGGDEVARGIFIVKSPLSPLFERKNEEDRIKPDAAVVTFPVGTLTADGKTNGSPVYVIAHSSGTGECNAGESVLYTSTMHSQPEGYTFSAQAVSRVLGACSGSDSDIAFVCHYTQAASASPLSVEGKVVHLGPMPAGLAFDERVVEECKDVYETITGTREGFLEMGVEMRKLWEGQNEQ